MAEEDIDNKDLAKHVGVIQRTIFKWRTNSKRPASLKKLYVGQLPNFLRSVCSLLKI